MSSRLPVPVHPGSDLVDVGFRLGLGPLQVAFLGVQRGNAVAQLRVPLIQLLQLGVLGQAAAAGRDPAQLGVEVGELEQPQLRLGRCFHGSPR